MLTVKEALDNLLEMATQVREWETIAISEANGRVLAESLYSRIDVPNTDNAAMGTPSVFPISQGLTLF